MAAVLCGVAPNAKFLSRSTLLPFLFFLLRPEKKKVVKILLKKNGSSFRLVVVGKPGPLFLLAQSSALCGTAQPKNTWKKEQRRTLQRPLWERVGGKLFENGFENGRIRFANDFFQFLVLSFIIDVYWAKKRREASERMGGWVVVETKSSARVRKKMF